MITAIYPGSFDPITNGHLDIINVSSKMFDRLIILVAKNINKQEFLSVDERLNLIKISTSHLNNIIIDSFTGLTANYAKEHNATILVRGVRTVQDFENELMMAHANEQLNINLKTIFIPTEPQFSYISSSMVKEIFLNNGCIKKFVPPHVTEYLNSKHGT